MGTRADYYVGVGPAAEWLGSTAWDGYPCGLFDPGQPENITTEEEWRKFVADCIASRDDFTDPSDGWPWPWENSRTTDYAYTFHNGCVQACSFGHFWFEPNSELETWGEPDAESWDDVDEGVEFPNMSDRQNVQWGSRKGGIMIIGPNGIVEP
jgi:hypothetical protein